MVLADYTLGRMDAVAIIVARMRFACTDVTESVLRWRTRSRVIPIVVGGGAAVADAAAAPHQR